MISIEHYPGMQATCFPPCYGSIVKRGAWVKVETVPQWAILYLGFCKGYYGIRYPLPKLGLVAVTDFASGAMENRGAITFKENLLLHYPDTTSKAGEQRICEVIAHEIVHQYLAGYIGEDSFQEGSRHYLREYSYSCAASRNLWEVFEKSSEKPVASMMKSWVERVGFYRVTYRDGGNLTELGKLAATRVLPPEDRWALQDDLYALARCGDCSLDEYLDFLSNYNTLGDCSLRPCCPISPMNPSRMRLSPLTPERQGHGTGCDTNVVGKASDQRKNEVFLISRTD
jgi:hypothetical protein